MSVVSVLSRVLQALPPFVVRDNAYLQALLGASADEIAILEAKTDAWGLGADDLATGTVTVTAGSAQVTLVGADDARNGFQANDELVLVGSQEGQNGRYTVVSVDSATTVTLDHTFTVAETGLFHARTTERLHRTARGFGLFPGGYEPDREVRDDLLGQAGTIHLARGSTTGVEAELERIANGAVQLLDPVKGLDPLATGRTIATGGGSIDVAVDSDVLGVGDDFTVASSGLGSNGRYFVYTNTGASLIPARRAVATQAYARDYGTQYVVQLREDREHRRLYLRVVNDTSGSASALTDVQLTVSGASITGQGMVGSPAGVSLDVTGSTARTMSNTSTVTGWAVAPGNVLEGWIEVSTLDPTVEFSVAIAEDTPGTVTLTTWGAAGLFPRLADGSGVDLTAPVTARWGGLLQTTFPGGAETDLTVYTDALHGWYLGFATPGTYENDAYTVVSPDEFVVVEVDHRNYAHYTDDDVKVAARDHLIPLDTEYVLAFI